MSFDVAPPDLDHPKASFTTDLSTIKVTVPIKTGMSVSVNARRSSSNPVLPFRLQLNGPSQDQQWDVTVQHAWCNAMECRFAYHGSNHEPTDRLEGWLELRRPPDATQTLYSNLSLVGVCVEGTDEGTKSLTVNVVAGRQ